MQNATATRMLTTLELELNTLCDRMEHVCFNCGKEDWFGLPLFERFGQACNYVQTGVICRFCQKQLDVAPLDNAKQA